MSSAAQVVQGSATGEGDLSAGTEAPPLSAADLWNRAAPDLAAALGTNYTAWFSRAVPAGYSSGTFELAVPSHFVKEWVEGRYVELIQQALSEESQEAVSVVISVDPKLAEEHPAEAPPPAPSQPALGTEDPSPEPTPMFHPKYTFDSFVIGDSNRFAHAAGLAVAEAPRQNPYNPLFVYGGAGLGKTHLLHAIGRYVKQCHPTLTIRYVNTEQFLNDFIEALHRRTIPQFHRRYRAIDVLLVDDVQFLENKEKFQEEFFHTFNALHPNSQIVITSDRSPKKIPTLEERLRTRFEWGLITDIQPPDLETRLAILSKKCETEQLVVPPDVLEYIAAKIQTNIRELEGALIRVAAYTSLTRSQITLESAKQVLQSLLPSPNEARITSELVMAVAADYFDVTTEEICSASRSRPLVNARQMAMYLCRELTDLSLPAIGTRFGGRDHSTVVFAVNKIKQQMKEREQTFEQVRELTGRIRQQAARV